MSSSASATSITPSPSATPSSSGSNVTAIAIGITVGIVVLMVAILLFWYLRRRRLHAVPTQSHPSVRSSTALDLSHPACRVTPFGSPSGDTSYFVHEPGVNMRVAHRLPDGGWEFSEIPSDSPATLEYTLPRRLSFSARSTLSYSSKEKLKLQPGELTTRGFVESDTDADDIPPPAYCHTEHSCGEV